MKTIPMVPACQNMEELHKLTDLICEYIHPQMVILFGYYAGMDFHNALKGYEILVIMEEKPTLTVRELVGYLKTHYPLDNRKEKNLSLHIFTAEFIHHRTSLSYFFYAIRKEGILLYESENCILKESVAYKPTRSYQQIVGLSDQSGLRKSFSARCTATYRRWYSPFSRLLFVSGCRPISSGRKYGTLWLSGRRERRSGDDLPENQILYERNCCLVVWRRTIGRMDFIRTLAIF